MAEPIDPKTFNPQTLIDLLMKIGTDAPLVAALIIKFLEMFQSAPQGGGGFIGGANCDHAACCDAVVEAQLRALCLAIRHRACCGD